MGTGKTISQAHQFDRWFEQCWTRPTGSGQLLGELFEELRLTNRGAAKECKVTPTSVRNWRHVWVAAQPTVDSADLPISLSIADGDDRFKGMSDEHRKRLTTWLALQIRERSGCACSAEELNEGLRRRQSWESMVFCEYCSNPGVPNDHVTAFALTLWQWVVDAKCPVRSPVSIVRKQPSRERREESMRQLENASRVFYGGKPKAIRNTRYDLLRLIDDYTRLGSTSADDRAIRIYAYWLYGRSFNDYGPSDYRAAEQSFDIASKLAEGSPLFRNLVDDATWCKIDHLRRQGDQVTGPGRDHHFRQAQKLINELTLQSGTHPWFLALAYTEEAKMAIAKSNQYGAVKSGKQAFDLVCDNSTVPVIDGLPTPASWYSEPHRLARETLMRAAIMFPDYPLPNVDIPWAPRSSQAEPPQLSICSDMTCAQRQLHSGDETQWDAGIRTLMKARDTWHELFHQRYFKQSIEALRRAISGNQHHLKEWLEDGDALPGYCFDCGRSTWRYNRRPAGFFCEVCERPLFES